MSIARLFVNVDRCISEIERTATHPRKGKRKKKNSAFGFKVGQIKGLHWRTAGRVWDIFLLPRFHAMISQLTKYNEHLRNEL